MRKAACALVTLEQNVNPEHDSQLAMHALRQSHILLDERPSAATRERILAAAAAREGKVGHGENGPRRFIPNVWRELAAPWFAGAAALGFVALVSIGVVLQVEKTKHSSESNPTKITIADNSVAPVQNEAVPRAAAPLMSSRPALSVPGTDTSGVQTAERLKGDRNATARSVGDSDVAAPAPRESSVDSKRRLSTDQMDFAQQVPTASSATASDVANNRAAEKAKGALAGNTTALDSKSAAAAPQPMADGEHETRILQNSTVATQSTHKAPNYRSSENSWLERIRELRKARLYDQADTELKLFLQSHPQAVLPDDLRTP